LFEWDDIRFFLALVRYGSIRGAAAALNVNHTTVSRRLRGLERRLGSRLVQRTPDGYAMTGEGEVIFASGEAMERELFTASQRIQDSDKSVSGKVRITMTDLLLDFTGPALQALMEEHDGLDLEISTSTMTVDIARRDADIALRLSRKPPEDLVGRRLGCLPTAIYGSRKLGVNFKSADLGELPWIRWQEPWKRAHLETWVDEHFPNARIAARVDTYSALEKLITLGAGVGMLSPWSAEKRDDLVQISSVIEELGLDIWLLMHPDLRGVRRMKVVTEALTHALRRRSDRSKINRKSKAA